MGRAVPGAPLHSLVDKLRARSAELGNHPAYVFLDSDLEPEHELSYRTLLAAATDIADRLLEALQPGDRVMLAYGNGPDAVKTFWGCLVAGVIPVPAPAPDAQQPASHSNRLQGMALDSGAVFALCPGEQVVAARSQVPEVVWLDLNALLKGELPPRTGQRPPVPATTAGIAYLQYTSGSTREPRGVVITHANLLAHSAAINRSLHQPPLRALTWLPWFHDYGLIHGVVQPVMAATPSYIMPTAQFLLRPLKWLEAISKHGITHSGAPDFAYAACVRALARAPRWNGRLDTWRQASCGAEPVRADTLAAFAEAFGPFGFSKSAWAPSYGLAEAVLAVSVHDDGSPLRLAHLNAAALGQHRQVPVAPDSVGGRTAVGCGPVLPGLEVRIVEPTTRRECAADQVGEIWVSGPSVSPGYWRSPEPALNPFGATLVDSENPSRPYLRTGDLGFLQGGELFITGRIKDLIVVHGRNLYPTDLEHSAETAHPGVRAGGVVAIAVDTPLGESAVLLVECSRRPTPDGVRELLDAVQHQVAAQHQLEPHAVVPLRAGALPRTSSGKPRRSAARQLYLQGALEPFRLSASARAAPEPGAVAEEETAQLHGLAALWSEVLAMDPSVPIDPDASFFELGGDSLLATQLVSRLRARRGVELPIAALFEAPTVRALARRLAAAPRIALGAVEGAGVEAAGDPLLPTARPAGTRVALSFSQERMGFMHRLAPDETAYNIPLALQLCGMVDAAALQTALEQIVERHEILRTRFVQTPDGMVGEVAADAPVVLSEWFLPAGPVPEETTALHRHLAAATNRPFDLERAPLMRAELIRVSDHRCVLLLVMHHIVSDQWSFGVLGKELAAAYNGLTAGNEAALPGLPIQYADHAAWHRRWFDTHRREVELGYWSQQLKGLSPLPLNTDFPRPPQQSFRGAGLRFELAPGLVQGLRRLGAADGASLSMVLIAALKTLLHRHTGSTDIAIGVPIANRHRLSTENLIGTFVNTLVFRTRLDGNPDFRTLLRRVRAVSLEAFAHQDMPFEVLVRELGARPEAGRPPLFNVMFNMVNTPVGDIRFRGLEWSRVSFDRQTTQFDLGVVVDTLYDSAFVIEYATDLFLPETVQRMGEHLLRILNAVVDAPQCALSALPLLGEAEHQRLQAWSQGPVEAVPHLSVTDWLAQALQPHAQHTALVCGEQRFTHESLHQRANQLARWLRGQGIARGQRVGLFLPRSPELVVALLAVLKTGAAYMPLDPEYPAQRLLHQVEDADLALLLTTAALNPGLAGEQPSRLLLDESARLWASLPTEPLEPDPQRDASPSDPAYLIYTSGSTGRPKGVAVPHRAVVNFLASMARQPGLQASDRLLAVTTPSFDIAVLELLLPLGVGATVVLASEAQVKDGRALADCIEREAITVLQATPSRWHLLVAAGWAGSPRLRALVGGEPLTPVLAAELLQRCGELWNMYGPTETTVWSSTWRVESGALPRISLGRPIANTTVQVLDEHLQPCPIGVPGEICIGGLGVALGYFRQEELTAERFIDQPQAPREEDQRIYRTGDRGRWRHDGTLEHGGRLDDQVKLRGVRLELGEIETHLSGHPGVARAVVTLREDTPGQPRLVAYWVPRGTPPTPDALRLHLRHSLPETMVPGVYVCLENIPVLPNGKTNRRALPAPPATASGSTGTPQPPRTDAERALWAIWCSVLQTESFGVHDNFFDLGGHSLQAVAVVHRIETELQQPCSLGLLFEHPTVAGLAAALDQPQPGAAPRRDQPVALLQPHGTGPGLFLLAGAEMYRPLAQRLDPAMPVYGLFSQTEIQLLETTEEPAPQQVSIETLAEEYVEIIRGVQPHGPYFLGGFSIGGALAFEVARVLHAAGEDIGLVVLLDTMLPGKGLKHLWAGLRRRLRLLRRDGWRHLVHVLRVARKQTAQRHEPGSRRIAVYASAIRAYQAEPSSLPVLFLQAAGDASTSPAYGWRALAPDLVLERVAGKHMEILEPPQVDDLANRLRNRLRAARSAA